MSSRLSYKHELSRLQEFLGYSRNAEEWAGYFPWVEMTLNDLSRGRSLNLNEFKINNRKLTAEFLYNSKSMLWTLVSVSIGVMNTE